MKEIIIASNNLDYGGIETSLIFLLKSLDYDKYKITLMLSKKEGVFLGEVPKQVNIIEYKPLESGNILIRKVKNRLKYIRFIKENKNKYDVSICYASYINLPAKIMRKICKNNILWVHSNYLKVYSKVELYYFLKTMGYGKFKNLVFVSQASLEDYLEKYYLSQQKYHVCRNLLLPETIIEKSKEKITLNLDSNNIFINIARHEEKSKKITRILEAAILLKKDKIDFHILLVGEGDATKEYKRIVKEKKLDKFVTFIGYKSNPYPYLLKADCFVLSSDYEGDPITIKESLILKIPVISTDVGDVRYILGKTDGIIVPEKTAKSIYEAMKTFIHNKKIYIPKYDINVFNKEILNKIDGILGAENEI